MIGFILGILTAVGLYFFGNELYNRGYNNGYEEGFDDGKEFGEGEYNLGKK